MPCTTPPRAYETRASEKNHKMVASFVPGIVCYVTYSCHHIFYVPTYVQHRYSQQKMHTFMLSQRNQIDPNEVFFMTHIIHKIIPHHQNLNEYSTLSNAS